MPRDASGNYTLPAGNPVVAGTIIETDWANPTMSDIGTEMTNSLSRTGEGGMLAPLKAVDGSLTLPAYAFNNAQQTGFYLVDPADLRVSIQAADVMQWTPTGVEVFGDFTATNLNIPVLDDLTELNFVNPSTPANTSKIVINTASNRQAISFLSVGNDSSQGSAINLYGNDSSFPDRMYFNVVDDRKMTIDTDGVAIPDLNDVTQITFENASNPTWQSEIYVSQTGLNHSLHFGADTTPLEGPWMVMYGSQDSFNAGVIEIGGGAYDPVRTAIRVTATSGVELGHQGNIIARSIAPGSGGLEVNNTLTGAGFERVLTVSDLSGGGGGQGIFQFAVPDLAGVTGSVVASGTTDPATNPHVAIGGDIIQGKADATTVAELNINPLGGNVIMGVFTGYSVAVRPSDVELRHGGQAVVRTTTPGNGGIYVNNNVTASGFERVLTESDLAPASQTQTIYLTADESFTNTSLANFTNFDSTLSFDANGIYSVEAYFCVDSIDTVGASIAFPLPSTSGTPVLPVSMDMTFQDNGASAYAQNTATGLPGTPTLTISAAEALFGTNYLRVVGRINIGGTGGSVTPQRSLGAAGTGRFFQGSWIRLTKLN